MSYVLRRFTSDDVAVLTMARQVRAEVYLETDQLVPQELTDDLDVDADDDRSLHVGAWFGAALVGTIRVIMPRSGRPLPVEDQPFNYPTLIGRPAAEISRMVVAAEHRRTGTAQALWREAYHLCVENGVVDAFAVVEKPFMRMLLSSGLPFRQLGEPEYVYHAPNYPIVCDIPMVMTSLTAHAPALAYFFAQRPGDGEFHPSDLKPEEAEIASYLAEAMDSDELTA